MTQRLKINTLMTMWSNIMGKKGEHTMLEIEFEYKDTMSKGEWRKQSCRCESVDKCIEWYGLNEPDVEYKIKKVTPV